jgi:hypothetical protein
VWLREYSDHIGVCEIVVSMDQDAISESENVLLGVFV